MHDGAEEVRAYTFDLCAHEGFSQEEMFSSCGLKPLLSAAVDGYAGGRTEGKGKREGALGGGQRKQWK